MRRALGVAIVSLLVAGVWTGAQRSACRRSERARALLHRAEAAEEHTIHSGILETSAFTGPRPVTCQVRLAFFGPHQSYAEYLTPPVRGVIVVRDGAHSWRYDPSQRVVYTEAPPDPPDLARRREMNLLQQNYEPRLLRSTEVAGRTAEGIALVHRYTRRVARKLWVDEATGLVLKSEEYSPDGALTMRTTYRTLSFAHTGLPIIRALPASATRQEGDEPVPSTEAILSHTLGVPIEHPAYLPEGFELEGVYRGRCGCCCGSPVAHLRYSDGLRGVSIFQCTHRAETTVCKIVPLARSGLVRVARHGSSFVLIGEVGRDELQRMAASLP